MFEKYVTDNIPNDCCKLVFIWILICNVVFRTWAVQEDVVFKEIVKIVSSECEAFPTEMAEGHLVKYHGVKKKSIYFTSHRWTTYGHHTWVISCIYNDRVAYKHIQVRFVSLHITFQHYIRCILSLATTRGIFKTI